MTNTDLARLARLALTLSFAAVGCAAPATPEEEMGSTEAHVTANPGQPDRITIVRQYDPSHGKHWVSVRDAWPGMNPEAAFYTRTSGSRGLFLCDRGEQGTFASGDPNCEGRPIVDFLGYVDEAPGKIPLYRCLVVGQSHFISADPGCEGQTMEGGLGWVEYAPVPAPVPVPNYWKTNTGVDS